MSEEILWIRIVSFYKLGVPQAFALVLALFLLGVAAGAAWGRRYCLGNPDETLGHGLRLMLVGGGLTWGIPYLIQFAAHEYWSVLRDLLFLLILPLSAALKAALFPIVHHLGSEIETRRSGHSVARVYFFNIAGSTLGPLLTGFILLDYLSAGALFSLLGLLSVVLAGGLALRAAPRSALALLGLAGIGILMLDADEHALVLSLASKPIQGEFSHVIENRHGIVHAVRDDKAGDIVYGGNVYDGRTNVDLVANTNWITRAYILQAVHPAPKRVLVIGLSSGAWTRVLSAFPGVEIIEVVEINPAYLELMRSYSVVSPLLADARVKFHIDDGRRWLRRHPEERFDLVVMNSSFHWRANATNLLSVEFMALARSHLSPGGIMAFNATGSPDIFFTATQAFPHAYRWGNFIYVAEHDFRQFAADEAEQRLYALRWPEGESVLDRQNPEVRKAVERLIQTPFVTIHQEQKHFDRPLERVTDANMIIEYRHANGI